MNTIERLSLSEDFWKMQEGKGQVHSCFDKAVNLCFWVKEEERMITLLRGDNLLLPDSILLPETIFCKIAKYIKYDIIKYGSTLSIGPEELYLDREENKSLYLLDFVHRFCSKGFEERLSLLADCQRRNERKSDLERLPERYRNALEHLAEGYAEEEKEKIEQGFNVLAGVGKGLTPAGDDAMLGVLAVMCAKDQLCQSMTRSFEELSSNILNRLLEGGITTKVSAKYLKCACKGQFAEAIGKLAIWIFTGGEGELGAWIDQIVQTGHTSGADILYGMAAACRVIYKKKEERCMEEHLRIF